MQTTVGNLINDRAWAAEPIPGLESHRWTGYIDVRDTDIAGKYYPVSLPNTGRSDELQIPDRVMVLPANFKVNHFAIAPYVSALAGTVVEFSLRNPGFLDNELTTTIANSTPYLNERSLRVTAAPTVLPARPYLAHQVWVRLVGAPRWNGRLIVSLGAMRPSPVFDFFQAGERETGAPVWGQRSTGEIGVIPGSEGFGEDGIRPNGKDFAEPFGSSTAFTGTVTSVQWSTPGPITSYYYADDPTGQGSVTGLSVSVSGTGNYNSEIQFAGQTAQYVYQGTLDGNTTPVDIYGLPQTPTFFSNPPGTYTFTARSVADPTKTATLLVNRVLALRNVTVSVGYTDAFGNSNTPATIPPVSAVGTLLYGDAYVVGAPTVPDSYTTWTVTGPATFTTTPTTGRAITITPTGAGTIVATARSVYDTSKTATLTYTVTA